MICSLISEILKYEKKNFRHWNMVLHIILTSWTMLKFQMLKIFIFSLIWSIHTGKHRITFKNEKPINHKWDFITKFLCFHVCSISLVILSPYSLTSFLSQQSYSFGSYDHKNILYFFYQERVWRQGQKRVKPEGEQQ